MTTANQLLSATLQLISSLSPGESIPGQESDEALTALNRMLAAWSAEGLMPPCRTLESFPLAAGVGSRTIGASGQLVTTRPDVILDAYLRDSSGQDEPVDHTMTEGEYNAIRSKSQTGKPARLFFDPQFPNATLYFDCVTDQAYTLFLSTLKPVNQFPTVQTAMTLPGEYEETIIYLLAERLAIPYGFAIPPDLRKLIEDARRRIKRKNVRPKVATFDPAVVGAQPFNAFAG